MTIEQWKDEQMEQVKGIVFISCLEFCVPISSGPSQYQVFNDQGHDQLFNITVDEEGEIIEVIPDSSNQQPHTLTLYKEDYTNLTWMQILTDLDLDLGTRATELTLTVTKIEKGE